VPQDPRPASEQAPQVLVAGALMIAASLGLRAWAVYPSWFFTDDFRLMLDAEAGPPTPGRLLEPFDNHLLPLARLTVWAVTQTGAVNWGLAATITLALALASSAACLWMLLTLFGPRRLVLVPLAVYLTSAVVAPAHLWWSVALTQLPLQVAFFWAVASWVSYLRTRSWRHLASTLLALVVALGFYEKSMVIGLTLAALALGWFASGSLRQRASHVARHYWPGVLAGAVVAGGYLTYYAVAVPRPFEENETGSFVGFGIADTMLGTTLPAGLLGGPWTWWDTGAPIVLAGPPNWTVHLAWVVIAALVAYGAVMRTRTLRAWALLLVVALTSYAVLTVSRGQLYGSLAGYEYRYLSDVLCVAVLAVGLVFAELEGAVESSAPRTEPVLRWTLPRRAVVALTALVAVGGVASWVQYALFWHRDNIAKPWVQTLQRELRDQGPVDLADQVVPPRVFPDYAAPRNRTSVFVPLFSDGARFPAYSDDLQVVAPDGSLRPVELSVIAESRRGPQPGCGYPVTQDQPTTVPLRTSTDDEPRWLQLNYVASGDDTLSVQAAGETTEVPVEYGPHTLWVQVDGEFDEVRMSGLPAGAGVCVDLVQVGDAT
jgi:hypothetical protein